MVKLSRSSHFSFSRDSESDFVHWPIHLPSLCVCAPILPIDRWDVGVAVVRLRAVHPVIPVAALYPHATIVAWGKASIRVATIAPILRLHHLRARRIAAIVVMLPATAVTKLIIDIVVVVAPSVVVAAIVATGHEHHPSRSFHFDPSLRRRGGCSTAVNTGKIVTGRAAGLPQHAKRAAGGGSHHTDGVAGASADAAGSHLSAVTLGKGI